MAIEKLLLRVIRAGERVSIGPSKALLLPLLRSQMEVANPEENQSQKPKWSRAERVFLCRQLTIAAVPHTPQKQYRLTDRGLHPLSVAIDNAITR